MILGKVRKMIWGVLIIFGLVALDQVTKVIARIYLQPKGSIQIIKNFFHFTYVENRGGAWGIFGGNLALFIIITIISLGAMIFFFKDFDLKADSLYSISLCLLIAGTIGNFIDRVIFKYVTDFLDFYIFGYDFPVFNVADICIVLGVGLLVLKILFFSKGEVSA